MHAHHVATARDSPYQRSRGAFESLVHGPIKHAPDGGFTRCAKENGVTKHSKAVEVFKQLEIFFDGLAEAKAGIDPELILTNARVACQRQIDTDVCKNLRPEITTTVGSCRVHNDHRTVQMCDGLGHRGPRQISRFNACPHSEAGGAKSFDGHSAR